MRKLRGTAAQTKAAPQEDPLIEEIRHVRGQLDAVHTYFSLESDEDLLEAAIYHREALQARYRYLLRLAREKNTVAAEIPVESEQRERWIN